MPAPRFVFALSLAGLVGLILSGRGVLFAQEKEKLAAAFARDMLEATKIISENHVKPISQVE